MLTGLAAHRAQVQGLRDLAVSLSHEGDLATAVVIATLQPDGSAADVP